MLRYFKYLYYKLVRHPGTPDSISRGIAVGLFIGFLIPIGGQMIIAWGLAVLLRAKTVPALAATWLTNPYTIIFIYPVQCYLGSFVVGPRLSFSKIKNIFNDFFETCKTLEGGFIDQLKGTLNALMDLGSDILYPFIVGGGIIGIILAFIGYFATYGVIVHHRQKKDEKLRKRLVVRHEENQS